MNKSFIVPIFLFISFLVFAYLIMPEYNALDKANQDLEERELELRNVENYYGEIKDHFNELKNYEENLNKIESALPDKISLAGVANFLQLASSESGVFLETISVSLPRAGTASGRTRKDTTDQKEQKIPEGVLESGAEIEVSGYYDNFKTFIEALEQSARLIEIKDISIVASEEIPSLHMSLQFYSY